MPALPSAPGLQGQTRYRYFTQDGGPPNEGKPPAPPKSATSQPPACFPFPQGPPPPYGAAATPSAPAPSPFVLNDAWGNAAAFCVPNPGAPPPPGAGFVYVTPAPATATAPPAWMTAPAPAGKVPPVSGNRVKGQLAKFSDSGAGYVFSKKNVAFHIFEHNIIEKYKNETNDNGQFRISDTTLKDKQENKFALMLADCRLPLAEFIEQIDCIKRAPSGYPHHGIGICELLEQGNGWFQRGDTIYLNDYRASTAIEDIWSDACGEAGRAKPVHLVRLPCCKKF